MNTLILEIGNYSIRAAVKSGNSIDILPIGLYLAPYCMPSICTKLPDGKFVWGDYAKYWSMGDGCLSYTLISLEKQTIYKDAIADLLSQILVKISHIDAITFVIPANWSYGEPKKTMLSEAAKDKGISRIDFVFTPIAVCNKVANFADKEYAIFYDAGYKGVSISILQRQSNTITIIDSVFLEEGGGLDYNRLMLQAINDQSFLSIDDLGCQMLYTSHLENKATFLKERLSFVSECLILVDNDTRTFKYTNADWHNTIAPSISKTLQACDRLLQDNHIDANNLKNIYLYGGTCNIPCVEEDLLSYAKAQFNNNVQIVNISRKEGKDAMFIALHGALTTSINSSVTIRF